MLALPYTACKCERYQLRMRAISRSKHTKLKNTKIYSKGVLVNHTKSSTNENFLLYGIPEEVGSKCSIIGTIMVALRRGSLHPLHFLGQKDGKDWISYLH